MNNADIIKMLIEVFGPAAVTLILLIAAISKMWPQMLRSQDQTRDANTALVEAIAEITRQFSQSIQMLARMISDAEDRLTRQHEKLANQHERLGRVLDQHERSALERSERLDRMFSETHQALTELRKAAEKLNGR